MASASAATATTTTSGSPVIGAVPSGLSTPDLLLDSDIRDWVVLPLLVIMIAAGLLRHYMGIVLKAPSKTMATVEGRSKSSLHRASRLRQGSSNFITSQKWEARRRFMSAKGDTNSSNGNGYLREQAEWAETTGAANDAEHAARASAGGADGGDADIVNPLAMMEGMKGQMAFMVQNMVMMQGISHFFQGFILVKVPFALTNGFKGMFQRGLQLSTLETSYVSSVSWYFLVMYGLRATFRLVIGEPSQEMQETGKMQHDLGMGGAGAGPSKFDAPKMLITEADNLELLPRHKPSIEDVEKRLLGKRYPKKKISAAAGDNFFGQISAKQSKKKNA